METKILNEEEIKVKSFEKNNEINTLLNEIIKQLYRDFDVNLSLDIENENENKRYFNTNQILQIRKKIEEVLEYILKIEEKLELVYYEDSELCALCEKSMIRIELFNNKNNYEFYPYNLIYLSHYAKEGKNIQLTFNKKSNNQTIYNFINLKEDFANKLSKLLYQKTMN